jgi:hypothetical protein
MKMRLAKRVAITLGVAVAALTAASAAIAHDRDWDDHGWKHGKKHHRGWVPPGHMRARPVIVERPVIYREVPAYSYGPGYGGYGSGYGNQGYYGPPPPPSLNINIPLR